MEKEKLFKIAKILVGREIRTYNKRHTNPEHSRDYIEYVANDLETEILIRPGGCTYVLNVDRLIEIANGLGASYYIDVTKNNYNESAACIVIYF